MALNSQGRPYIAFHDMDTNSLLRTWWNGEKWLTQTVDGEEGEGPSLALNAQDELRVCYFKNKLLYYAAYY